jgi:hypothetical protein
MRRDVDWNWICYGSQLTAAIYNRLVINNYKYGLNALAGCQQGRLPGFMILTGWFDRCLASWSSSL